MRSTSPGMKAGRTAPTLGHSLGCLGGAEDDAGRRAMDIETALGIDEAAFGRRHLAPDMNGLAFGAQPAGRRGDRPYIVDLDLERRVAAPGRRGRMDGAGHHRI